jgi:hypothetical protein
MSEFFQSSGSVRLTGDGAVGPSGKPIRVFSATQLSGGTAGILVLRNGTTDSGTVYIQKTAPVVSNTDTVNFENGLLFPNGCFFDKDTNVTHVVVEYRTEA